MAPCEGVGVPTQRILRKGVARRKRVCEHDASPINDSVDAPATLRSSTHAMRVHDSHGVVEHRKSTPPRPPKTFPPALAFVVRQARHALHKLFTRTQGVRPHFLRRIIPTADCQRAKAGVRHSAHRRTHARGTIRTNARQRRVIRPAQTACHESPQLGWEYSVGRDAFSTRRIRCSGLPSTLPPSLHARCLVGASGGPQRFFMGV